jgi:predicted NUDIX family NTP pyrophosphohydrolase
VRPSGDPFLLEEVRQAGGKVVTAFALEGDLDPEAIRSNTFEMEWPPRSGRLQSFPEVDRAAWFTTDEARSKILAGQAPLLDRLREAMGRAETERQPRN